MRLKSIIAAFAVTSLLSLPIYGQVGSGNVRGKVVDREGKPVQGAIVRLEHLGTHQTDDGKTGRNGEYSVIGLYGGQYKATLIVDGRAVMVRGDGVGNAFFVTDGSDATVSFDMKNAPATPPPTPANTKAPVDEKARAAEKKANEEMKASFAAGTAAMGAKNYEEAVKQFQMASEKDPTQSVIFAQMGLALANLKKYDDAVAAYRKSIAIKPDDAAVHALVTLALASAGKTEEAMKEVQEVAKLDPAMAGQSYYNLGAIYTNRGKSKEAVEAFKKAIEIDPKNAQSYYQLGIAYFGSVDTIPLAITALEKFLQLQSTGPDADAAKGLIDAAKAQIKK